jgi:amidase
MFVNGPMARRVADLKVVLGVLSGAHPRDPWSIPAPMSGAPRRTPIKVAVLPAPPGGETDPTVSEVVWRAAAALAEAGYVVEEACPPRYEDALRLWGKIVIGDFELAWPRLLPLLGRDGARVVEGWRRRFPAFDSAAAMSAALMERDGVARAWSMFFDEHQLLLSPTWASVPFENGFDVATEDSSALVLDILRPVLPANLLGLPAACVPAGRDKATGLPIGVMLTAGLFREDLCLDAALAIEQWHGVPTPIDPVV